MLSASKNASLSENLKKLGYTINIVALIILSHVLGRAIKRESNSKLLSKLAYYKHSKNVKM